MSSPNIYNDHLENILYYYWHWNAKSTGDNQNKNVRFKLCFKFKLIFFYQGDLRSARNAALDANKIAKCLLIGQFES